MSRLGRHQRDWEDLAQLDPLWAIQSSEHNRFGGADDEAFMASGRRKVDRLMARLDRLGVPARHERVLDFGCGVGRLTLPLADRFEQATGIDIAPSMIEQARLRAGGRQDLRYLVNDRNDLQILTGEQFDLVYTALVLQHLPSAEMALRYLGELARLVAPGGVLVAQVPVGLKLRLRLQHGRRVYAALRRIGVSRDLLYRRLGLQPMRMTIVPRSAVEATVEAAGLRILNIGLRDREGVQSLGLYAAAPPR
jgi:SAM-dependent methyltransferase